MLRYNRCKARTLCLRLNFHTAHVLMTSLIQRLHIECIGLGMVHASPRSNSSTASGCRVIICVRLSLVLHAALATVHIVRSVGLKTLQVYIRIIMQLLRMLLQLLLILKYLLLLSVKILYIDILSFSI